MSKWVEIAPQVAIDLLGEPKKKTANYYSWNNKGSLRLNLEAGTFYDFENKDGGGVEWLIRREGKEVKDYLDNIGFNDGGVTPSLEIVHNTPTVASPSFTREDMARLWTEAEIKVMYSNDFMVLRFPEGHRLSKIKYLPYSRRGDIWVNKRPEGQLPIKVEERSPKKPVLIVEGEKALQGAMKIYDGDCCCHHGGVSGWKNSDWSPLYGRDIFIYPDNDDAGKKFANEIKNHLRANGCFNVVIAEPHEEAKEKDDLWDAWKNGLYSSSEALEKHINDNQAPIPLGALYFERADQVTSRLENPQWLIEEVCEKQSLMSVFGKPKSGKTFVMIEMAVDIAAGVNFFGNRTTQAPVVYLCGEGKRGVVRRLAAIEQYRKAKGFSLKGIPLYLSNKGARVNDPTEYELLRQELDVFKHMHGEIGMVIFDTFQRNFTGNESSAQDVGDFINCIDNIIHDYKCCVCLVHHTGHGNTDRQRGSSVLGASIDYEFKVERIEITKGMGVELSQTLNKDGLGMEKKYFELEDIDLIGDGFDLTSAVLVETDKPKVNEFAFTKDQKQINDALIGLAVAKSIAETGCEDYAKNYWFKSGNLYNKVLKPDNKTYYTDSNIRNHLSNMAKDGKVVYLEGTGNEGNQYKASVYSDTDKEIL